MNILHDERYTGTYIIGKRESREVGSTLVRLKDESQWIKIPDHHPAIISKEQFEQAQKNIRKEKCVKKNAHPYLLGGKVYCGCCQHRMQRIGNMTYATNRMGSMAVAAYAAGNKIDGIAVEPLRSLGMTMITYTAQNYGAGKYKRILQGVRQSILISAILSLILGLTMFFGGRGLAYIFLSTHDEQVLGRAALMLLVHGVCYMILALLFIFRFTVQGLGQTLMPTLAGFMELVMRTVAAFLLVPKLEFLGAAVATPLSWLGALIPVAVAYILAAKKLRRKIANQ